MDLYKGYMGRDVRCEESHEEMAHLEVGQLWVALYEGFFWVGSYMKVARATPEQGLEMGLRGVFAPGAIIAINREGHASNNC